jgi:hypothetical protein
MRQPSSRETRGRNKGSEAQATTARETDPLLQTSSPSHFPSRRTETNTNGGSSIRARRSSRSPTVSVNQHFGPLEHQQHDPMNTEHAADTPDQNIQQAYNIFQDDRSRSGNMSLDVSSRISTESSQSRSAHQPLRRHYVAEKGGGSFGDHPPLLEIPEEIYGVRKAALSVLKPLTKTWVSR